MIKACVFDAYGTLFDLALPIESLRTVAGDKAPQVLSLWRQKQLEYSWLRTLMKSRYVPFEQLTEDALKFAFTTYEIEDQPLLRGDDADLLGADVVSRGARDARAAKAEPPKDSDPLQWLSRAPKSGLKHTGLSKLVDQVISAHTVSKFKVDPAVYQLAEDSLDLYPEELIFQSSNAWDVAGATAYGFTTVWINRTQSPPEGLGIAPDHELGSLKGLPELISSL